MSIIINPLDPAKAPTRGRVLPALAILILLVTLSGIYLWRSARVAAASVSYPRPPIEVEALTVRAETLPRQLDTTGTLEAVREVTLSPEIAGRVTHILFEAGEHVSAGQPLIQLFDAPERADRAAALSRTNFAQIQFARSRELAATGAEPREVFQQHEAALEQARAALKQVDARLIQKQVRAPFAGRIGIRRINLGQYLNPGDPVATLTAFERMYVNFTVPQQNLAMLHHGGAISVKSDAVPGRVFTAHINAIEPLVGNDTRNVSVQAELANEGELLRPGLFVTVGITQAPVPGTILVPKTAVQTSASGDSVYVVRKGRAELVPVTLGREVDDRVIVDRGLAAGEMVVTTGLIRLQPGAEVKLATASPPGARR